MITCAVLSFAKSVIHVCMARIALAPADGRLIGAGPVLWRGAAKVITISPGIIKRVNIFIGRLEGMFEFSIDRVIRRLEMLLHFFVVIFGVCLADQLLYRFIITSVVGILGTYIAVPLILLAVFCLVDNHLHS